MITFGQHTAVSGSATALCVLPPGPCTVVLSNVGTATAYVGPGGTAVTTSNGFPVPSGSYPVVFPGYPGGAGAVLSCITTSGSASVGFIVSSASGGTGP